MEIALQNKDPFTSIIQAKLHRPFQPVNLVSRTRLTHKLDLNRQRPLTLISAPAAYHMGAEL
jgi:ATP/maltotriose-dependent transcriptional regulator MalT